MAKRIILLTSFFLSLGSCTPKGPYEIKSPCVAADSDNPYIISPCVKRKVNLSYGLV